MRTIYTQAPAPARLARRLIEGVRAWHARWWLRSAERTVAKLQRQIDDDHAEKLRAERQLAALKRRLAR